MRVGASTPTLQHLPSNIVRDSAQDVADLAALAGLNLFGWQVDYLRGATAERVDGTWAALECGLDVCRQNGKGAILQARQLAGLFLFGERLQLHTAHEFKTAYEHFRRMVDLVQASDELNRHVKIIRTGAGDQAIELKNGCRLRFLARSRSSGRGFSGDVVYLDEAFQLEPATVGALLPAMSARPNPQVWYTSSAPHRDSTVFHRLRRRAQDGDEPRLYFAGWNADPDDDPTDHDVWHRVNPSMGLLIDEEFVEAEQRAMDPAEFARERLGIPEMPPDLGALPISLAAWDACTDMQSTATDPVVFALDASPNRESSSIVVAATRPDGLIHVELVDTRPGVSWLGPAIAELVAKWGPSAVVVDGRSPAASEVAVIEAAGVKVTKTSLDRYAAACGGFVDKVTERTIRHRGQQAFRVALEGLRTRKVGEVMFAWARSDSTADITPIVAATLAVAELPNAPKPAEPVFAY